MRSPVYYFIPGDMDDEQHPNVFMINDKSLQDLTFADVRYNFPLPGTYLFRFKTSFKNTYVWKDTMNDNSKLPCYEGKIVAKVSRLRNNGISSINSSQNRNISKSVKSHDSQHRGSSSNRTENVGGSTSTRNDLFPSAPATSNAGSSMENQAQSGAQPARESQSRSRSSTQSKERRYSDLLNMDDIDDINASTSENGVSATTASDDDILSSSGAPKQGNNDLMGLSDLDFSATSTAQVGMRPPTNSLGGTPMDALDPRQMRRASNSTGSSGSGLNVNTSSHSHSGKARRDSPRSAALKGLMSDLSGLGSL